MGESTVWVFYAMKMYKNINMMIVDCKAGYKAII